MRTKRAILLAASLVLLTVFLFYVKRYMDVDKCLDNGGRWNYATGVCEYREMEQKHSSSVEVTTRSNRVRPRLRSGPHATEAGVLGLAAYDFHPCWWPPQRNSSRFPVW
jgi:hypothetical protein